MQVLNLTIPLRPYFPVGSVFPWESPFQTEDIATLERNAARLFYISMGSESGTRLMGHGLLNCSAPQIQDLALDFVVNRPARVLSLPKGAGEPIEADEIDRAFQAAEDLQEGDAVLVATGWGDGQRWKTLGEAFALESPYWTTAAADCLLAWLQKVRSNLILTDCAYLDRLGVKHARAEWTSLPSWLRPPWPSDQAKAYLRHYTAEMARMDFCVTRKILRQVWAVAGLANAGQLPAARIQLTCLPMFVQGAGEAPCTVVAEF